MNPTAACISSMISTEFQDELAMEPNFYWGLEVGTKSLRKSTGIGAIRARWRVKHKKMKWCETCDACESEISDMINFTTFHQLLRSWVGKHLKLIMQDDEFSKTCKCICTVRNLNKLMQLPVKMAKLVPSIYMISKYRITESWNLTICDNRLNR